VASGQGLQANRLDSDFQFARSADLRWREKRKGGAMAAPEGQRQAAFSLALRSTSFINFASSLYFVSTNAS
jgi:hypothetical protein